MENFLKKLKNKENLNFKESKIAFENMMSGKLKEDEIFNFLILSSEKGETGISPIKETPKDRIEKIAHDFIKNFICSDNFTCKNIF